MNIDSGLFHLVITLRSIPNCNGLAQTEEPRSAVESRLPEDRLFASERATCPGFAAGGIRPMGASSRSCHKKVGTECPECRGSFVA
jgi:hypothetical protein